VKSSDELKIRNRSPADRHVFQKERALHHENPALVAHVAAEQPSKRKVSEETNHLSRRLIAEQSSEEQDLWPICSGDLGSQFS